MIRRHGLLVPQRRRSSATTTRRGVRRDAGPRGHLGRDSPPPADAVARVAVRRGARRADVAGRTACTVDRRVARGGGPLAGRSRGRGGRNPCTRSGAPCASPRCTCLGASAARASTRSGRRGSVPRRGRCHEIRAIAQRWGIARLWETTERAIEGLLHRQRPLPVPAMGRARARAAREDESSKTTSSASARRSGRYPPEWPRGRVGRALLSEVRPTADEEVGQKLGPLRSLPSGGFVPIKELGVCWPIGEPRSAESHWPGDRASSTEAPTT